MVFVFCYVVKFVYMLCEKGVFNMLLIDGVYVLVYCINNLYWIICCVLFGKVILIDVDMVIDF